MYYIYIYYKYIYMLTAARYAFGVEDFGFRFFVLGVWVVGL